MRDLRLSQRYCSTFKTYDYVTPCQPVRIDFMFKVEQSNNNTITEMRQYTLSAYTTYSRNPESSHQNITSYQYSETNVMHF
jgi:hypothetical protein